MLNQEEISRIKNLELREIWAKYWRLKHEAFINKQTIFDSDLNRVMYELIRQEQEELQRFRDKKIDI